MLVGGGAESTAGGFKLLRLLIAANVLRLILLRTCLPKHAVTLPRVAGRRLQDEELLATLPLLLIVLFVGVVTLAWLAMIYPGTWFGNRMEET
jgi:trk system potassium uptake protein TrkH